MNNNTLKKERFSLQPTTFQEAKEYAEYLADTDFVPRHYQGKAGNILVAVQIGHELGLKPLQSLQSIAVINGRPSIYGDAALALVKAHSLCEDIQESFNLEKMVATCIAKRKGKGDVIRTFSKDDAIKAKLWGSSGPWLNYPARMLQMRARGFAIRDQFPDILIGLVLAEEAQDYTDVTNLQSAIEDSLPKRDQLTIKPQEVTDNFSNTFNSINSEFQDVEDHLTFAEQLSKLIAEKGISNNTLQKWLNKAKVKTVYELSDEDAKKCIDYINRKL